MKLMDNTVSSTKALNSAQKTAVHIIDSTKSAAAIIMLSIRQIVATLPLVAPRARSIPISRFWESMLTVRKLVKSNAEIKANTAAATPKGTGINSAKNSTGLNNVENCVINATLSSPSPNSCKKRPSCAMSPCRPAHRATVCSFSKKLSLTKPNETIEDSGRWKQPHTCAIQRWRRPTTL